MKKTAKIFGLTFLFMATCFSLAFGGGKTEGDHQYNATGTGFFINTDGIIITNAHVIEAADEINVRVNGGNHYPAQLIKQDDINDLAILQIDYRNPYHFRIRDFSTANLGDKLSILGFPLPDILSQDIRLTEGSLSSKSAFDDTPYYFQHSAPTHPGNSGGPILNSSFQVIGVASASINDDYVKNQTGANPQNIHFGVKSDYITSLLGSQIRPGAGNVRSISDAEKATVQIICSWTEMDTSITITNNTGYEIKGVYVSLSTSDSWGSNRLGGFFSSNLKNSNSTIVSSLRSKNRYDIRLEDTDGDNYIKWEVLIQPNQNIVFTFDDYW